jgi:hypothetical protein
VRDYFSTILSGLADLPIRYPSRPYTRRVGRPAFVDSAIRSSTDQLIKRPSEPLDRCNEFDIMRMVLTPGFGSCTLATFAGVYPTMHTSQKKNPKPITCIDQRGNDDESKLEKRSQKSKRLLQLLGISVGEYVVQLC